MNVLIDLIKLSRPHQWSKNIFVFAGIIFGHAWNDPDMLLRVFAAAAGFSLLSSSIYVLNDIIDREQDALHPKKKHRPLAAGRLTTITASIWGISIALIGLGIGYWVSLEAFYLLITYSIINIAYTFYFKHQVIIDVFFISAGFMLRILVGTIGIDIPPSQWLVLCGLMVTLFLGFTKRRAEILAMGENKAMTRNVLEHYSPILLDKMIGITASGVIMSYALYTMNENTIKIHGTENLIYTIPFVMYGIFRYIFLLHHQSAGTDTANDLKQDIPTIIAVFGWVVSTIWIIG